MVVGKAGKSTHGRGNFYSPCAQKSIKSVCFFALSLVDTATKTSYMIHERQVVYSDDDLERATALKKARSEGKKRAAAGGSAERPEKRR
jgi:hypothetical protein